MKRRRIINRIVFSMIVFLPLVTRAQSDEAIKDILAFQKSLNDEYKNPKESPLEKRDFRHFKGHDFFPVDLQYRVTADLDRRTDSPWFDIKTTDPNIQKKYRVYGIVTFALSGKTFHIPVYQSESLMKTEQYKDYLFFPFTDMTNGEETYGGGRYIDLIIPEEGVDTLTIDFNKAYNPYCAYSHHYSCPLVPKENDLDVGIWAGVRLKK